MGNLDRYRMLVQRFIQNYYELHGNFDKIELSVLGRQIRELADADSVDIQQFCYKQLGYPDKMTEERLDQFAHYQLGDADYFMTNGYVESIEDIPEYLAMFKNTRKPVFRERKYPKKLEAAIAMLTKYYNDSKELYITVDGAELTTKVYISMLKLRNNGRVSINNVLTELNEVKLLVGFKKGTSDSIQNGVFYYKDFTDNQLQRIQKEAISNIAFGLYLNSGVIKNVVDLPFLSLNDNNTYLSLLDMCRGLGITYAEYMLNFGYVIKDQTLAVQSNSMIINKVGESVYITDLSSDTKRPVYVQTVDEFNYNTSRVPFNEVQRMELFK